LYDTLLSAYSRQAEDTLRFYAADAAINGLKYPRHQEETAVAAFVRSIRRAGDSFQKDPLRSPLIPNWNRVESALPTFLDQLREAVRLDNDLAPASASLAVARDPELAPSVRPKTLNRVRKGALSLQSRLQPNGNQAISA